MTVVLPLTVVAALLLTWPRPAPARLGRDPSTPRPDRRLVLGAALLAATAFSPPLGATAAAALWGARRARRLRSDRAARTRVVDGLPDTIDLLLLATEAGLSLPLAHEAVTARCPEPFAGALAHASGLVAAGRPRADALLDSMTPLGPGPAGLAHLLADHLRYGTPLAPALEALRSEARANRRHAVQESARQVPVRLLGPLVLCVLPAFGVLTVAPLLLVSLGALGA